MATSSTLRVTVVQSWPKKIHNLYSQVTLSRSLHSSRPCQSFHPFHSQGESFHKNSSFRSFVVSLGKHIKIFYKVEEQAMRNPVRQHKASAEIQYTDKFPCFNVSPHFRRRKRKP